MYTAIVTAPSAFLFSYPAGGSITDELLSGWLVTVREQRGDFLKITTQYRMAEVLGCPADFPGRIFCLGYTKSEYL